MLNNDHQMLEEAYLSVSKKNQAPEPISNEVTTDPNPVVSVGPMDSPAPGVDVSVVGSDRPEPDSSDNDTAGIPVSLTTSNSTDCGCGQTPCMCNSGGDLEQEDEEDQMTIDNLNSIRESILKVASYCAEGGHLEAWAQQKLAISMDNLAEIARRLH